jgi:zinc protease
MKKPLSVVILVGILAVLPAEGQQERFRRTPPNADPFQIFRLPPIEIALLANEMTVGVVNRENFPMVILELVVLGGESASPEALPGLATFTGRMFGRGVQQVSATALDENLDSMGATLTSTTGPDFTRISYRFLESEFDRALDLLARMILEPAFAEGDANAVKLAATYGLQNLERNLDYTADTGLRRQLFENHPYRKSVYPRDAVRAWTLRDLTAFFNRYYRPDNVRLLVAGNRSLRTATRSLVRALGAWPSKETPSRVLGPLPRPDKPRLSVIDVPGAKDCVIVEGTTFPPVGTAEHFALTVLNHVLGGTTNSRLFMNLRESKGYAYNAFSDIDFYEAGGVVSVHAQVTPDAVLESLREISREIDGLAKTPVPSDEIELAKSYLIGHFPIGLASFEDFSAKAAEALVGEAGDELWTRYYEQVIAVSPESAFAAAQFLLSAPFVTVIAGDKSTLAKYLVQLEDGYDVFDSQGRFLNRVTKDKKGAEHETRGVRPELQRRPGQR